MRDEHPGRHYAGPERRFDSRSDVEPVMLTRKYADAIDGISLAAYSVGDRLPLRAAEARMLLAEGWAEPATARRARSAESDRSERTDESGVA